MSTYTIGEIADRSGFSASSLRYYEGIGLVEPASRTASGYRLYNDGSLDRLAFIARAKQLGCTLDEARLILEGRGVLGTKTEPATEKAPPLFAGEAQSD